MTISSNGRTQRPAREQGLNTYVESYAVPYGQASAFGGEQGLTVDVEGYALPHGQASALGR